MLNNHIIERLITRFPELTVCKSAVCSACETIIACYKNGNKLLVCGNGGSAADSDHIVGELMKGFYLKRPIGQNKRKKIVELFPDDGDYLADHLQGALPAISLTEHSSLNFAYANDVAPDMVFAQQVFGYGVENDVLLAISTSGNASNVLNAVKIAKAFGMHTIGLTGSSGGLLKTHCDTVICVPADFTPDIQELHLPVYHAICATVEEEFFGINSPAE
jgi:D-sedoheptulose 7-phosphate isomerase